MEVRVDETTNETFEPMLSPQNEGAAVPPPTLKRGKVGPSKRTIFEVQMKSLKGNKYLLNGTTRKDWLTGKGDVASHFRSQEKGDEQVAKLEEELNELRSVHGKEEVKFRNSGKKIREQKAAVRRKEMDTLLEEQGRTYMVVAEESTRRDFHFISKYDREIEWLERRNKKYHDDRFDFAKLVPRILMVKLRNSAQQPALMVKELRRRSESPQVRQAAFEIIEANIYACPPPHKLALECVNEGVCEELVFTMSTEEWFDNVYLQDVCVSLTKALCERSIECRLRFDHRMVSYLVRTLRLYKDDSSVLIKTLNAITTLCDQSPKQRIWAAEVGAGKEVVVVAKNWKSRDWRVYNACLKSLNMLVVRCPQGKRNAGTEALVKLALTAIEDYSRDDSFEIGRVNAQIVRGGLLLIKALISQDDGGQKEKYDYEAYLRRGGTPVGEDLMAKEKADKSREKFLAGEEDGGGEEGEGGEDATSELGEGQKCVKFLEDMGGIATMVKAVTFHIADAISIVHLLNVVHGYLYFHCGGAFDGKMIKEEISGCEELTNFLLECLMRYRGNKVIVWSAVCNLHGMCVVDSKVISHVEKFGRGNREENADEEDSMVLDEESLTSGKLDGCRIICSGMGENRENVHLLEQYCRLIMVMSKQLDARMALLRANGIDVLEENKSWWEERGTKGLGGYFRLSMNAHLALETGKLFS